MTTQPQEGGRRAIDRVLAPGYVDDLASVPMPELRRRRHETEQEETDLSYARRLLQGRLDLLRAEQSRRAGDDPDRRRPGVRTDSELAEQLAAALTDGPRQDHGLGRHLTTDPTRVGEHRRAAEQAVADVGASDPLGLDDDGLLAAIEQVSDIEADVSGTRHRVQQVMDALTAEVARRYKDGLASVDEVLVEK